MLSLDVALTMGVPPFRADIVSQERDINAALDATFAGLEDGGSLLLAVSGGPDSIALLLLATRWRRARGADAPAIHIATVDHGLRPESRQEAQRVASVAAAYGLPHTILPWLGPKPTSRVQERARAARYALLGDHARAIGATHVLTAHHADDQAETVLLRLGRGSGISGLAGMRRVSPLASDLWLVRPLLDRAKAELVALCQTEGHAYVDDPSNQDPAYARARLRAQASRLAALGLDTPGLSRFARRMARADAALEAETDRVEASMRPDRDDGFFRADLTAVRTAPDEIRIRLVRRAVAHVAPQAAIRLARLETLTSALWSALESNRPHRTTLAGTRIVLDRDKLLTVKAESGRRRGLAPIVPRRD